MRARAIPLIPTLVLLLATVPSADAASRAASRSAFAAGVPAATGVTLAIRLGSITGELDRAILTVAVDSAGTSFRPTCRIGAASVSSARAGGHVVTVQTDAPAAATPASDLRIGLGRLLGEHADLLMATMRSAADGAPDTDALLGGLDANTQDLQAAIASVYGDPAGTSFRPIWQRHIDAAIAWAKASKTGDQNSAAAALQEMAQYRTDFSTFLSGANPKISGDAEIHALQLHLDQLRAFVDKDFDGAFATEHAAYTHMFDFGDDLARAIVAQFPDRFPDGTVAFSPRTTLRLTLGRLLGEHLVLAAEAMRAGLVQRADASAAASSLKANSTDLAAAIGRIFGEPAQVAFADLWGRHVDTYLQYIEAVRTQDATARQATLASLHSYHVQLAAFLHGAIPKLSQADLEALISHHVTALINQVDAAAAGDHVRTVAVTREAYAQMFVVADALGNGIADQFPGRFDDVKAIPPTDTVPEAGTDQSPVDMPLELAASGTLAIVALVMWAIQRRSPPRIRQRL